MKLQQFNKTLALLLSTLMWGMVACGGQEAAKPTAESKQTAATVAPTSSSKSEATVAPEATTAAATTAPATETSEAATVTVMEAAKLLDLRKLPLPEKAEAMGQAEVGMLMYQTSQDIPTMVEMYRSLLTKANWQENSDLSRVDASSATLYFNQQGFSVNVSVSDMGNGSSMINIINSGNIDLATLPKMTDAAEGYQFPNTAGYFSASKVMEVAEFIRKELTAQGWQEYTRPNTSTSNNDERQDLTFKKNGLNLSASISASPAQPGKTYIQYATTLLPMDLPTPTEVTNLQIDMSQPYVSFRSAADFETLAKFYRDEMAKLGWKEATDKAVTSDDKKQMSLTFANEAEKLALMLNLTLDDGQTMAQLSGYDAAALAAAQATATPEIEATPEVEATLEATPMSETPSQITADFPTPADAQEVNYDDSAAELTFTSPSEIKTIVAFYRETLKADGWEEDETFSMVDKNIAMISFKQGEDNVSLNLFNDGFSGKTQATIDLSEAAAFKPTDSEVVEEVMPTVDPSAPTFTLKDWPIPAEATEIKPSKDEVEFTVPWNMVKTAEFYKATFETMGFDTDCLDKASDMTSLSCSISQNSLSLNFFVSERGTDKTNVDIMFTNYNLPSTDTPTDSESGELMAEDKDGLPVPNNYTSYSSEGSPFSNSVTFSSPSELAVMMAFYEKELAAKGWTLDKPAADGKLTATGPDGNLSLEATFADDSTTVKLMTRNEKAARDAGILPAVGQSRVYLVNPSESEVSVTINEQEFNLPAGSGMASPESASKIDLAPGKYSLTIKGGATDELDLKADTVWSVMVDPKGSLPLQMY